MACCPANIFKGCFPACPCLNIGQELIDPITLLPLVPEAGAWVIWYHYPASNKDHYIFITIDPLLQLTLSIDTSIFNTDQLVIFQFQRPDGTFIFQELIDDNADAITFTDCFSFRFNRVVEENNSACIIEACDDCANPEHDFTVLPAFSNLFLVPDYQGNFALLSFTRGSCVEEIFLEAIEFTLNGTPGVISPFIYNLHEIEAFNVLQVNIDLKNNYPGLLVGDSFFSVFKFKTNRLMKDGTYCSYQHTASFIVNII